MATSGRRHTPKRPVGEWRKDAPCIGRGKEMFPGPDQASIKAALAICKPCPVKRQCLEYAQTTPIEQDGIWGGYTAEDRYRLRRGESVRRVSVGGGR